MGIRCFILVLACILNNSVNAACNRQPLTLLQGVVTHFAFLNYSTETLSKIPEAGFNSIRDEVFWDQVEANDGSLHIPQHIEDYVNLAIKKKVIPILVLGYGHPGYDNNDKPVSKKARSAWVRYAAFVVRHFKGRVRYYELWNEWDIAIGGTRAGKPEDYAQLIKDVGPVLRQEDAEACLIAGAVTPDAIKSGWLFKAINAGLLNNVDALSVHTYNYYQKTFNRNTPETWAESMRELIVQLQTKLINRPIPIYVTEMGWPSDTGPNGVTVTTQAAFAQRLFLLSQTIPSLCGVWWYGWQNDGVRLQESEDNFGIIDHSEKLKPVWGRLKEQASFLEGMEWSGFGNWSEPRYQLRFMSKADKPLAELLTLWRTDGTTETVLLEPQTQSNQARFSSACDAKKTMHGWQVSYGDIPCLARIDGAWKTLQKAQQKINGI